MLLGSLVEGESVILTACIAAYFGYMSISKIVIIAFLGTLIADQTLYFVGLKYGRTLIDKRPSLKKPAERAYALLHRWDIWFILSFRFIYGIRTISPVIIGSAGVSPRRFIPLNFLAAVIWTAVSCTVGYFLGGVIDVIGFHVVERYALWISLGLLALLIIGGTLAWRKMHPPASQASVLSDESNKIKETQHNE